MSEKHSLLWVDLLASVHESETLKAFEQPFEIRRCSILSTLESQVERVNPHVLCFNFDFPSRQGLETLQRIKRAYTSIPILMLTVQHSEALAIWAFRCKVFDYLVKPITRRDFERCLCNLMEVLTLRGSQPSREAVQQQMGLVPEESRANGSRNQPTLVVEPAIRYVEKSYRDKTSSSRAAALCNLTPFQFSRLFKETYEMSFQEYVLRFRIREACRLLKNPHAQISQVGYLVGFNDPSYFAKMFRRYTTFSPSQYCNASEDTLDPSQILKVLNVE